MFTFFLSTSSTTKSKNCALESSVKKGPSSERMAGFFAFWDFIPPGLRVDLGENGTSVVFVWDFIPPVGHFCTLGKIVVKVFEVVGLCKSLRIKG